MRWDIPEPFTIEGWIVMDGAGGGFIAFRRDTAGDKVNLVCATSPAEVRAGVARADGVRPIELATRARRRRPGGHLRSVS
ncbi:hypothetical protein [Nonomuraea sp. NPDC003754]